jgi:hypothetical protein
MLFVNKHVKSICNFFLKVYVSKFLQKSYYPYCILTYSFKFRIPSEWIKKNYKMINYDFKQISCKLKQNSSSIIKTCKLILINKFGMAKLKKTLFLV